jgi:hypothetical protein
MALDGLQPCAILFGDEHPAKAREGIAFGLRLQAITRDKIGQSLGTQSDNQARALGAEQDSGQRRPGMFVNLFTTGGLYFLPDKAGAGCGFLFAGIEHEVVDPFEEISRRLLLHPLSKVPGELVLLQKAVDLLPQVLFGSEGQRPIE